MLHLNKMKKGGSVSAYTLVSTLAGLQDIEKSIEIVEDIFDAEEQKNILLSSRKRGSNRLVYAKNWITKVASSGGEGSVYPSYHAAMRSAREEAKKDKTEKEKEETEIRK